MRRSSLRRSASALRSRLGDADFEGRRTEGREMSLEQAVEYALDEASYKGTGEAARW